MAKKRDYQREMQLWGPNATKEQSQRHKARRAYEKAHGPIPKGMDVDHKKAIKDGGGNSLANLRLLTKKANRSKK